MKNIFTLLRNLNPGFAELHKPGAFNRNYSISPRLKSWAVESINIVSIPSKILKDSCMSINKMVLILISLLISFGSNSIYTQDKVQLKDAFKDHFLIGAAVNSFQSNERDSIGVKLVKTHFNTITPENILKWQGVHPKPDAYSFEDQDNYVKFGEKNNLFIIGHTLVWHAQTPRWVFEDGKGNLATRDTLLKRMRDHIHTVAGRYKGRIKGWDVVNEALNEDGTLRQSLWFKIIGEDFIEKAFEFAHEADPDAELYYNDYNIETKMKRDGAISIINNLKSKGLRIDGVGIQGHYKMDWPAVETVDSAIVEFAQLGVKVMFTELDIDVLPAATMQQGADVSLNFELKEKLNPYKNGLPDSIQQNLAKRYADLFKVFVKHSDVISRITFWGVTDRESWLNGWPVRGRTNYPLLFDREGKTKPAFDAVIKTAGK